MKDDEITLREAAKYVTIQRPDDKREREAGEAQAVLDTMLAASRAGHRVVNKT